MLRFGWLALLLWLAGLVFLSPLLQDATTGLIYTWLYFNLLVFWPAFVLTERLPPGPRRTQARLLLLTATFLALEVYPQPDRNHANWAFVLFLPLAGWLLWEGAQALWRLAPSNAPARLRVLSTLTVALLPVQEDLALADHAAVRHHWQRR